MKKGKLIVIDGSDGSGKTTQAALLIKRLKKEGVPSVALKFPQYQANFFGAFIKKCLHGEYGDFIGIDPHIVSTLYAADRWESKDKINRWLKEGKVVVLDRYVSANQMHQGGKIKNPKKRLAFLQWLDTMEHKVFGLPRPDMILYLHVPVGLSVQLMTGRSTRDLADRNRKHLTDTRQSALTLLEKSRTWRKVECAERGAVLSKDVIHERIWAIVKRALPR